MMRRIFAAGTLLVLLFAPPLLLLRVGFTDVGAIALWSATDVRPILLVLTLLAWLAWLAWLVCVAIEVLSLLARRPQAVTVKLPGLGLPRAMAAALVAAAFASPAVVAQASPAMAAPVTVVSAPQTPDVPEPVPASAPVSVAADPDALVHRVLPGDDLWSLAQHYYGEGAQWRLIVEGNPVLAENPLAPLVAGQELLIRDPVKLITVRRGDTLSALALTHMGDAHRWPEIHALNKGRVLDPDEIDVGWVLRVPWLNAMPPAASSVALPDSPATVDPPHAAAYVAALSTGETQAVIAEESAPERSAVVPNGDSIGPGVANNLNPNPLVAPSGTLVGGVTALAAAAVVGGLGFRRRIQRQSRPVGRRYAQPGEDLARYESALKQVGPASMLVAPERTANALPHDQLLARAQRLLADAWRRQDAHVLALSSATVDDKGVAFEFLVQPDVVPEGFARIGTTLAASWEQLAGAPDLDGPAAYPALVTLGQNNAGGHVMLDVMESGVLGVACMAAQGRREVLSAILVELSCAPWAEDLELLVVTENPDFACATASERILTEPDTAAALTRIDRLVDERKKAADELAWRDRRLNPDLGSAWTPHVILFERAVSDADLAHLRDALDEGSEGVAAVVGLKTSETSADWHLDWSPSEPALVKASGFTATPQTVPDDTRAAITGLFALAAATVTDRAPWWPEEGTDMKIVSIQSLKDVKNRASLPSGQDAEPESLFDRALPGPRLRLLGPIALTNCAGEAPVRAVRQCIEYCAWLHLHPGASPQHMARALLVAEGTRRSNMSRLRTWLGAAPTGALYLPDAYSGRIWLADDVTSDWGDLLLLTAPGISGLSLDALVAALRMVQGAPLADAAPSQWGWAEELRSDASSLLRDIGVLAARRALDAGDLDTARWAASRALIAAPDDELLMVERIRTEHRAGRTDDVCRLVERVTHTARSLGLDLLPETVDTLQEVMEGRVRVRR